MKSIGAADGGGCGSGLVVFAHHVGIQQGGGSSSYKETPPFTPLQATHQLISPQGIPAEVDMNSRTLLKSKRGWQRAFDLSHGLNFDGTV